MKRILSLLMGLSLVLSHTASAKPKEKEKQIPPGQARKAAAAATYQRTPTVTRSSSSRDYIAPSRSTTIRSTSDRRDSYDGNRYRSDRDGDRYRSSDRYRHSRPSIEVYRNWDRHRVYSWNNNRYRWYGGTWVIYDASPRVVYGDRIGGSVVASVQAELRRRGYDAGPADGLMGGRTRSAILDFQADHGLSRTGTITESLLRALDLA